MNDVLFLVQNALTRFMGGHEVTDVLNRYYLVLIRELTFLDSRYQPSAFGFQLRTLKTMCWLIADR